MPENIEDLTPKGDEYDDIWYDDNYSTEQEIYLTIEGIKDTSGEEDLTAETSSNKINPQSSFRVEFSSNILEKNNGSYTGYYIRIATEMGSINYQIKPANLNDNYITINNFPALPSKNNSLILYGVVRTNDSIQELPGYYEQVQSNPNEEPQDSPSDGEGSEDNEENQISIPINGQTEYQNIYIPPVAIDLVNSNLEKCDELYNITANGEYIYVSDLRMNITSGSIIVQRITANGMNTITDSTILSNIFDTGYSDSDQYHLFPTTPEVNNSKITLDIEYQIKLTNITSHKNILVPVINAYQVFSLIGKTKINNENKTVYGGIAIGQESTISELGEPSFECKYPVYINGIKIGYYPNKDTVSFSSETIFTGVNDGQNIRFSIFLGQPIYATSVNLSGSLKVYGINTRGDSEITQYSSDGTYIYQTISNRGYYTTTYTINASSIILTNINYKSGILSFRGNSKSTISTGAVSLVPNTMFSIAFK